MCSSVKGKLQVLVMNVTPESQFLREGIELGGFSIWEKGSEDTNLASQRDIQKYLSLSHNVM